MYWKVFPDKNIICNTHSRFFFNIFWIWCFERFCRF